MIIDLFYTHMITTNIYHFFLYIGPGMGGGLIALVLGLISAFFLGLWGILYYPIKRAIKNYKTKKKKVLRNSSRTK